MALDDHSIEARSTHAPMLRFAALAFVAATSNALAAAAGETAHAPDAVDCDSLTTEPVYTHVDFTTQIQPLINLRCAPCHIDISSGGMNLRAENVKASLLGADETGEPSGYPGFLRLKPGDPGASLIFLRLNCENAGSAANPIPRMPPPNGTGTDMQALIHDWIALGAIMRGDTPETTTDRMFLGNFDLIR